MPDDSRLSVHILHVFTKDAHEDGIEVRVQDHDVWLTQKAIGQLFDVRRSVVTKHLKNIYKSGELSEDSTCANFAQVADIGETTRGVRRYTQKYYASNNVYMQIIGTGSKRSMHYQQHRLLQKYYSTAGHLPQLNKSFW